jgi:hypothetical protein
MERPSKKEIKAVVDGLKNKPQAAGTNGNQKVGKLSAKKSSLRIRKQGI